MYPATVKIHFTAFRQNSYRFVGEPWKIVIHVIQLLKYHLGFFFCLFFSALSDRAYRANYSPHGSSTAWRERLMRESMHSTLMFYSYLSPGSIRKLYLKGGHKLMSRKKRKSIRYLSLVENNIYKYYYIWEMVFDLSYFDCFCVSAIIFWYIYKGIRVWILFLLREQFWKVMVQYPIFNEYKYFNKFCLFVQYYRHLKTLRKLNNIFILLFNRFLRCYITKRKYIYWNSEEKTLLYILIIL